MIVRRRSREPVIRASIVQKGYIISSSSFFAGLISGAAMPRIENPLIPGIRPARVQEASELSDLCVRSKAVWGYNETFMFLARPALAVGPEQIDAGDVWVATDAQGSVTGLVALGP